jgi:putative ABC transport system ATP-binding protein
MLSTSQLKFQYAGGPSFAFPDVNCDNGEHLLILGESGKGKTTLLHLLAGMLRPSDGHVAINETITSSLSGAALDHFRGKNIGIIFQTAHFVNSLNVLDNMMLAPFLSGKVSSRDDAKRALERLNIGHKAKSMPADLSVGEQQRVAIARAIFNNPSVILADEPTSALDDRNADEVILLLEEQAAKSHASLVIVTHDKRMKDRFNKQVVL